MKSIQKSKMINDTRFTFKEEKSLDQWVNDTLAPINDSIYFIMTEINSILNEVLSDVR